MTQGFAETEAGGPSYSILSSTCVPPSVGGRDIRHISWDDVESDCWNLRMKGVLVGRAHSVVQCQGEPRLA